MKNRAFKLVNQFLAGLFASTLTSVCLGDLQIISMQGESIGENMTLDGFSAPSLNKYGEIAFGANLEEADTGDSSRFESVLLHNSSGLHLLAATDQNAPKPGNDGVFEFFDAPKISELGIAMYRAKPRGSSWAVNERGIWISWVVNDPAGPYSQTDILGRVWDRAIIDFEGNESEEGGKYDLLSNPIVVEPLSFAFIGDLYEGEYDGVSGIWYQDARGSETWNIPEPRLLALTGIPLPGTTLNLDRIEAYEPIDTTGGIALAHIEQGGEITSANDLGLWEIALEGNATLLLQTGTIDTATGAPISSIGHPSVNESGQAAVWVEIQNETFSEGIYIASESTLQPLLIANAPINVGPETLSIETIFDPVINEQGDVAFLATIVNEDPEIQYALFRHMSGGSLELIAKTGAQAPGVFEGTVFDTIASPRINDNGQLAFMATLSGSSDTISDTTNSGIWAHDENGNLVLVVRKGSTLEVGEESYRTLSGFEIGGFNEDSEFALKLIFTNGEAAIAKGTAEPAAPPAIADQPSNTYTYMGEEVTLSVVASGQGPFLYQWYLDGEAIAGATESTLVMSNVNEASAGEYSVTIISPIGEVESSFASLTVSALPEAPIIVEQPLGYIAFLGEDAFLDARAVADSPIGYQWYKDGSPLAGETGETLTINEVLRDDEGSYYVVASNAAGVAQSETAEILVTDQRMVNISTRAHVGTGANVLIAGFAIGGTEKKTVLIRGVGPSLQQFGLNGVLENPKLQLHGASGLISENSGWAANPDKTEIANAAQSVGAFALPDNSDDAVMLVELDPGVYSAIVSGEGNTTGIALVEIYEVGSNLSRLVNISSRAFVGTQSEVVIPGVVVIGDMPTDILVRAIGPSLGQFEIAGALEHPVLEVLNSSGEVIASNHGWNGLSSISEAAASVGAFPIDTESQDAAMIISLDTGLYTLRISGEEGTTGVALVELYALP